MQTIPDRTKPDKKAKPKKEDAGVIIQRKDGGGNYSAGRGGDVSGWGLYNNEWICERRKKKNESKYHTNPNFCADSDK